MTDLVAEVLYPLYLKSRAVTTDSRKVTPGSIFFAFDGAHYKGSQFVDAALQAGAALCVVDSTSGITNECCVAVPSVLDTLQALARYHRSRLTLPVVAVTGTNGKTTTKELIHAVLSKRYRTHATMGNMNNHLGVPLTLLSAPADAEVLIVEMGANHPGEIDTLCSIAQPTCGLITTVGKAHLEGFGSFEGVVHTKTELYRYLSQHSGLAFVDEDNLILMEQAMKLSSLPDVPSPLPGYIPALPGNMDATTQDSMLSIITYGHSMGASVKGSPVSANPYMKFYFEEGDQVYSVHTHLLGSYNFTNAMAAVCVGRYFGVELFHIKEALETYVPTNNRSQFATTEHNQLILDCYNANPSSMKVAVENLAAMQHNCKWAILGSMKELGAESAKEHTALLHQLQQSGLQGWILVGEEFQFAAGQHPWFGTVEETMEYLRAHPLEGALILLKGSNSNQMWRLQEVL